ncbi:MAG: DUF2637 domain-containing protein [Streptomyces sp.]|nr:DUF2637 domain-containing protein [Streptomyces sp.]
MSTHHGERPALTPLQRRIVITVAAGAVALAAIGFLGSYAAVADLAAAKGFGAFSALFPIGIDAGIGVLLALDLLLTWIRIPFPLLRQTAWLLTVATISFNAAAASDPLGMGMHAVIPVLFIVIVEAGRHAIGRTADITADKHMEGVRLIRWLLAPFSTFRLWRRMRLWELRSYNAVLRLEQERLIERARLRARYGWGWRRKAPVEAVMALRLTRYGRALAPVAGVLDIEHAPAHSELEAAHTPVSPDPEPEPSETPDFETTVSTALTVTGSEPHATLADPVQPLTAAPDLHVSREPVLSPAEPILVSRPEPTSEPEREPTELDADGADDIERQITDLAQRLRGGERLTKTTAAQLLGVSPATAGRRLKDARDRLGDGTGFYP